MASLEMIFEATPKGFAVLAPWLAEPVYGATAEDCYHAALAALRAQRRGDVS